MTRRRVLHLSTVIPWPPDYGGRIATWNHLRADARHAEVGLVTLVEELPDEATLRELRKVCAYVRCVVRPRTHDGPLGMLRALFSGYPINLARYRWESFARELATAVGEWHPDVVVAQHLHMAPFPLRIPGVARILRHHNVDSSLVYRLGATTPNPITGALLRQLAGQVRRDEQRHCPRFDRCVMITEDDALLLKRHVPAARTAVVPAGLAVEDYAPVAVPAPGAPLRLVTAGSLVFRPTAEGLLEFVRATWPIVRQRHPDATFRVIGHCPPGVRAELEEHAVEVMGRVPEVRSSLEQAHAFIVSLRAGSGLRIKIIEAFAFGVPILSTTLGAEGIPATPGEHLLLADEPAAQADAIERLYTDAALNARMRGAARGFVEREYSLEAVAERTQEIYSAALEERDRRENTAGSAAGTT